MPTPAVDDRRNISAFTLDISLFVTGIAFIPSSTVIVGLASLLTENKSLVGLAGMAFSVSWFLPQLFAAQLVRGHARLKPFVLIPSLIGRNAFLGIALWLLLTGAADPGVTLFVLIGGIVLFNICDALAGVAWFDILGRALSPRTRGRVITIGQLVSGVLGIGAAEIVRRILSSDSIPFPTTYALIFVCTWVLMILGLLTIVMLREIPIEKPPASDAPQTGMWRALRGAATHDPIFRRVLLVRFLTGLEAMSASFYLVYVKERFGWGASVDGTFTQAIVFGALAGVALFGWLGDRFTTRSVIFASSAMFAGAPLIAGLVALAPDAAWLADVAFPAFFVVFLLRGALEHSLVLGMLGYLLDAAPERERAMYIGAFNTLGGVVSLSPLLGGLFIDSFGVASFVNLPYVLMFSTIAGLAACGLWLSLGLPRVAPKPASATPTLAESQAA
jgi:Major Facilitator Superfamily